MSRTLKQAARATRTQVLPATAAATENRVVLPTSMQKQAARATGTPARPVAVAAAAERKAARLSNTQKQVVKATRIASSLQGLLCNIVNLVEHAKPAT